MGNASSTVYSKSFFPIFDSIDDVAVESSRQDGAVDIASGTRRARKQTTMIGFSRDDDGIVALRV